MDLTTSRPPVSKVTPPTAGPSAVVASESPSEGEAPTEESDGLLLQEVSEESADLREEPTLAERDGATPETRQEVEDVPTAGPPTGSEREWQAPTSDSGLPPPKKTKRGRRSSTHRADLKPEVEQQSGCEVVGEEKELVKGAGMDPWQLDFNCEDVFRPVVSSGRRSVRRSLRNRSGSEGGSSQGLAWLPPSPTDQPAEARRRTRGRRLSSSQPL